MSAFDFLARNLRRRRPKDTGDAEFAVTESLPAAAVPTGGEEPVWRASSFDLRSGLEITEQPIDTLPDDLRDAFDKR